MATRLIAVAIVALTLIPFADWLPGGETDPEYAARSVDWMLGTLLCVGVGGLAAYLMRIRGQTTPPTARVEGEDDRRGSTGSTFAWGVTLAAGALYALIAHRVFSGRPLLIDEIVQVLQARWHAEGRLWVPTPTPREFFSIMHLVDLGPKTFGQFPAGGPAMLALGSLMGAEWLVGPVVGALAVRLFAELLRGVEPTASRRWHRITLLLFAIAPFGAFMFGSHMNHATALLWLLLAWVALARATTITEEDATAHPAWGFVTGLGLGMAATIRPLDGMAFALPAAAWLLWRARRGGRPVGTLLLSGVGVAIPIGLLLWVNHQTTGSAFLFGYEQLWGDRHRVGFHPSPWGPPHTPLRGIELLHLGIIRLSIYLFEAPFPALVPAAVALWYHRRLSSLDRYLLAGAGALLLGYGAYWHDGLYLGPRFFFPLLPIAVLWSARVVRVGEGSPNAERPWGARIRRGGAVALGVGAVYAVITTLIVRVPQYRNNMTSIRRDVAAASADAGVRGALVLVQESWGAQLLARLWALEIPRSEAEEAYRTIDICTLEQSVSALEREGVRGAEALARIRPLARDSAQLIRNPYSSDKSQRIRSGGSFTPECLARFALDRRGFAHLPPMKLAQDGNVYVRWIPGREREIVAQFPGRPVYLLGRAGESVDAAFTWTRVDVR